MIDDLFYFDYVNDVERFTIDMYLFMMKLISTFEAMIRIKGTYTLEVHEFVCVIKQWTFSSYYFNLIDLNTSNSNV